MAELRRINPTTPITLEETFLAADDPVGLALNEEAQTELIRSDIDWTRMDAVIEGTISSFDQYDATMDGATASKLHEALPITRREAADQRMWAWLGLCKYPRFVAWRWKPNQSTGLRSIHRFMGNRVRQAFARLWWAAELTRSEDGDYSLTDKLVGLKGFQDVYEAIFGRAFCAYRPALSAFTHVVGPRHQKIVRATAKELGYALTTLVLETMSEEEIASMLEDLVDRVEVRQAS